jgi:thiol peroxidase
MKERKGIAKFGGQDQTIVGDDIQVGQTAPEFTLHTHDWKSFSGLGSTEGKVRVFASLPSIKTPICDRETRRFNEEAASLGDNVVIITISTDLPFSLANWCGQHGIDQVVVASDHVATEFGAKYGCLMKEWRILRRAVFVVDQHDTVVYADYMPHAGHEPNYEAVLDAVRQARATEG